MADTSQHELSEPHTNGAVDGLTEEEKSKMRPADIDADMREMERRRRVEMMMNSRLFREELERIIETQMKDGGVGPSGLLQQISDMMGAQGARFNPNGFKSSNCVVPINDIRGVESMGYAKGEKLLRCKLAAVFRLLDLYGWTQGVGGLITARLNQDQEHFLVNPYGLLYHEVTASSLVKVDMQGSVVEQGTTNFGVHVTAFQLHSAIHAARPDIKCIIHITTPSVIAVSSLKCGLLPLGQESIVIGETSVHQYIGGVFEPEEKEKIARNLGPVNKIMFLTNRGVLCCGETVEEAFYNVYNTVLACETQLKLIPAGIDNLSLVSEESRKAIFEASRKPPVPQHPSVAEPSPLADKLEKRWRIGGTEFEALMRMLDNAGFRTGYIYRHPLVKGDPPRPRNDVEVPPAVSSLGYLFEEEELYRQGLWKGGRKGTDRTRWLNSPNVYQKVEILETGTPDPKKITKWVDQNAEEWVTDGSPTHSSTPVRIESALQFVPKNTNPKEFKQLQQQIKDYRRADKISAGPQSHILEGVTWDEAKKMQDATISATGEQVVLVGAASKGIIQRGFQHNAMVYKTPYAKNPFDAITDQELDQYKKDVERKQKGDPYDESQSESEALSSFNVSRATHESSTAKSPIQSPISVTSETEEESRDEPRVLRIATKQVPLPSQPEVVLSDVDATSEFLNEMRRTAIDPRNDINRRDCESSDSGSVDSGQSYGWPTTEQYDRIHLEVARSRTVAPRMTPMITEIVKSYEIIANSNRNSAKITTTERTPPVPPKPYIALRHAFFNNNNKVSVDFNVEKTQVVEQPELETLTEEKATRVRPEGVFESETVFRMKTDGYERPEIVGAILKNVNDLHTECLASDFTENEGNEHDSSDENGNCLESNESLGLEEINADSWNFSMEDQVNNNSDNESFLKSISEALDRLENDFQSHSITEVVKSNLTPTKMLPSMLPESNNSSKYNLDSTNMSIIYSLTPTSEPDDLANNESKPLDSCSVHDEESDYMWVDLATSETKKDGFGSNETIDLLDSSMESLDNVSDQGSDLLELPYSTVKEIREMEGESFNQDIRSVVNQIIEELGDIEMYTNASNFVVQEKLQALGIAKEIADRLVGDLPCYEEGSEEGVIVVQEIVHHVIDNLVSSESSPDSYNWKRVKESTNSGLKEMQNGVKTVNLESDNVEVITIVDTEEGINAESRERKKGSDERLFITLDNFSPSDECCDSPLDCDECYLEGVKRFQFVSVEDNDFHRSTSSLDNLESDVTDQDNLGEAILQFCAIAKPCCTPESMALNFSVIKSEPTETGCTCCAELLPPIEEANESLDNFASPKSPKNVESPSDYLSCREDSNSTGFQSFKNCQEDSDVEIVYVADKEQIDGTYTVSDSSMNSMDSVSSIESDDPKLAQNPNDVTYSADISTNIDDTVFERRGTRSSSSSDARLSDENCFDSTTYMADVSAFNPGNESTAQNFMAYSHDTNEFMKLEEELKRSEENDILSSIDPPPKYEDTTLYRVVSRINLADLIDGVDAASDT